jgi:hypothetical protein
VGPELRGRRAAGAAAWTLLLLVPAPALAQREAPAALLAAARAVSREVAGIRHLEWLRPVDFQVSDRATIRRFAQASLDREMSADQWAAYEALLEHCGLLPAGVDLRDLVVRLYAEQVAGYYEPARKTFYLADWLPQLLQRGVEVGGLAGRQRHPRAFIEKSPRTRESDAFAAAGDDHRFATQSKFHLTRASLACECGRL